MRSQTVTFQKSDEGKLKVGAPALAKMRRYIQSLPYQAEAGGLLLGRYIIDSSDIVVDLVTVPMRGDVRNRYSYLRRSRMHQILMEKAWTESKGTCTYLGEWHTHPESIPTPSSVDRHNWHCRLYEDTYEGESLFFLILGIDELVAWEAIRIRERLVDARRLETWT
jgi:integrative and conjugative element protein (TIGR02256 family)